MPEKDFLAQFSNENKKPDSFKEEVRTPVVKEKKPLNVRLLVIILAIIAVLGVVSYFIFLAPKIEMPNFIEQTKTDVGAWVKQQNIDTQGIIFKEEYSFDYDNDVILSQSVEPGTKVKNDVKITFEISKGANPDEIINLPDIKSMTKEEIQEWSKNNKLQKLKLTTSFNEYVEEGEVIEYSVSGCEEDSFTRGCTLKVSISKGKQPVGSVIVENFVGKTYGEVSSWATSKKIKLEKKEEYSNTVDLDKIISQSIPSGEKIDEGSTLTIIISKGKGVIMPDLTTMTRDEVDTFLTKNPTFVVVKKQHVDTPNYVISQSVKAGTMLGNGDEVTVITNLGSTFYLSEIFGGSLVGSTMNAITDAFNNARNTGIDGFAGSWANPDGTYSYTYEKGIIVSATAADSKGNAYDINGRLPLDVRIDVVISKGKIYVLTVGDGTTSEIVEDDKFIKAKLVDSLAALNVPFNVETNADKCDLYIDGVKKTVDSSVTTIEIIQGQKVVLK